MPSREVRQSPKISIHDDAATAATAVADMIAEVVRRKPNAVLGLATGGTPVPVYEHFCKRSRRGELDFGSVRTFNLDEYVGLSSEDPRSYRQFMRRHLFDALAIDDSQCHFPEIDNADRYDAMIEDAGGIDLQLLGIGGNGHIAFNEPGCGADTKTRKVALCESTRQANARFFDGIDEVPTHAVTMGIASILRSRTIVVMACGRGKRDAVAAAIEGHIGSQCPASYLQRHPQVTWHLDQDAAAGLSVHD